MKIEVSNGEIVDKLTILLIKSENIHDEQKLSNIQKEIDEIGSISDSIIERDSMLFAELYDVNKSLWEIEDKIRAKEKSKEFDSEFIGYARGVYYKNDERSSIKREINKLSNSKLVEEKSYKPY